MLVKFGKRGQVGPDSMFEMDTEQKRIERMQKRLEAWARALNSLLTIARVRVVGITLTYDTSKYEWSPRQISELMQRIRNYAKDKLFAYAWVAELQQRGAVHYHICLVVSRDLKWEKKNGPDTPSGWTYLPHFDALGWWDYGMTNAIQIERISPRYLTKYVQKGFDEQGGFPPKLRLFACVIRIALSEEEGFFFRLSAATGFVRKAIIALMKKYGLDFKYTGWKWEQLEGGAWLITTCTGWYQVVQSEYRYLGSGFTPDEEGGIDRHWEND